MADQKKFGRHLHESDKWRFIRAGEEVGSPVYPLNLNPTLNLNLVGLTYRGGEPHWD